MKVCAKCKRELDLSCFGLDNKSKDKCFLYCKDCCKIIYQENKDRLKDKRKEWGKAYREKHKYHVTYYQNNKESIKQKSKIYAKLNRDKIRDRQAQRKKECVEILGGRCMLCGNVVHPSAFDFHHINPNEKESSIKDLINCSWKRIKEELIKCKLVCANCHRKYHYEKERDELYQPIWLA